MKENFELLGLYNQRMNNNIYTAATTLTADEIVKNRGAFFGSILGTLNHIVVGDIIWLKRFAEHETNFSSLDAIRAMNRPRAPLNNADVHCVSPKSFSARRFSPLMAESLTRKGTRQKGFLATPFGALRPILSLCYNF